MRKLCSATPQLIQTPPHLSLSVHDVAAYILKKQGEMSAMKLQKLVYYSQAWSLVWDEKPLFRAQVEAWANGPVARSLYDKHRGQFAVPRWANSFWQKRRRNSQRRTDQLPRGGPESRCRWRVMPPPFGGSPTSTGTDRGLRRNAGRLGTVKFSSVWPTSSRCHGRRFNLERAAISSEHKASSRKHT